jgi:predicted MFS family arabinose efflux permease
MVRMKLVPTSNPVPLRDDARTIGLVSLVHGSSHFFHLLLPPLFPWLVAEFHFSYAQLGLLVSVFFVISGVGQALAGFLVDRVGARPVLLTAMCCFIAAGVAAANARGYGGLVLAAGLAGLGNSPFHPADFTILNQRVSPQRLGHAFSAHGISGNLGWALAPVLLGGIAGWSGEWRYACWAAAAYALVVLIVLAANREATDERRSAGSQDLGRPGTAAAPTHALAFLRLPSIWLCFSFFFWSTVALSAVQSFAGPALRLIHGLPLAATSLLVSGYMLFGAAGMVIGGFLTARVIRLERVIAVCLLSAAALLALAGSAWLPASAALMLTMAAGLGTGLAGPSRDMMIKRAAPPGATGRVYGTVYSGNDIGFALAAPMLGALLDAGHPGAVFWTSALALLLGVASAAWVGLRIAGRKPTPALVAAL